MILSLVAVGVISAVHSAKVDEESVLRRRLASSTNWIKTGCAEAQGKENKFLDRHTVQVDSSLDKPIRGFAFSSPGDSWGCTKDIDRRFKVTYLSHTLNVYTDKTYYTQWDDGLDDNIVFFDRHDLHCNQGWGTPRVMTSWKLETRYSDKKIRFKYRCGRAKTGTQIQKSSGWGTSKSYWKYTALSDAGESIDFLDRFDVLCPSGQALYQLKGQNGGNNRFRWRYRCLVVKKQTPHPTPNPTPNPSPKPTPKPSPHPTPKPSPHPTPMPTTPFPSYFIGQAHYYLPVHVMDCGRYASEGASRECHGVGAGCVGEGWFSKDNSAAPTTRVNAQQICRQQGFQQGANTYHYGVNWGYLCRMPGSSVNSPNRSGGSLTNFGTQVTWRCLGVRVTNKPTPNPTPNPTPQPTNVATPQPSSEPTPAPSPHPTPAPTLFPTIEKELEVDDGEVYGGVKCLDGDGNEYDALTQTCEGLCVAPFMEALEQVPIFGKLLRTVKQGTCDAATASSAHQHICEGSGKVLNSLTAPGEDTICTVLAAIIKIDAGGCAKMMECAMESNPHACAEGAVDLFQTSANNFMTKMKDSMENMGDTNELFGMLNCPLTAENPMDKIYSFLDSWSEIEDAVVKVVTGWSEILYQDDCKWSILVSLGLDLSLGTTSKEEAIGVYFTVDSTFFTDLHHAASNAARQQTIRQMLKTFAKDFPNVEVGIFTSSDVTHSTSFEIELEFGVTVEFLQGDVNNWGGYGFDIALSVGMPNAAAGFGTELDIGLVFSAREDEYGQQLNRLIGFTLSPSLEFGVESSPIDVSVGCGLAKAINTESNWNDLTATCEPNFKEFVASVKDEYLQKIDDISGPMHVVNELKKCAEAVKCIGEECEGVYNEFKDAGVEVYKRCASDFSKTIQCDKFVDECQGGFAELENPKCLNCKKSKPGACLECKQHKCGTGSKPKSCEVAKTCDTAATCSVSNSCDQVSSCEVNKSCSKPRSCPKTKTCTVRDHCKKARSCRVKGGCKWYAFWEECWWETIVDILRCGFDWVECGVREVVDQFECGVEIVVDALECGADWLEHHVSCGTKTITSALHCGTEVVTDGLLCGFETVQDIAVCGAKEVTSRAICGGQIIANAAKCGIEHFVECAWEPAVNALCEGADYTCEVAQLAWEEVEDAMCEGANYVCEGARQLYECAGSFVDNTAECAMWAADNIADCAGDIVEVVGNMDGGAFAQCATSVDTCTNLVPNFMTG